MSRTSSEVIGSARGSSARLVASAAERRSPSVVLRQASQSIWRKARSSRQARRRTRVGGDALVADGASKPVGEREEVVQRIHPAGV